MARSKNPTAEIVPDGTDHSVLAAKGQALSEQAQRSLAVSAQFGDGQPYERERVIGQTRFFMSASAEAMLEAGKCLIQIKENEPHGEFIEIVEERLGIHSRTAQRMMQAAARYLAPALQAKASSSTLLTLGKAKLLELLSEPDEDIEALADGGTIAGGLDIDDVRSMTALELRAALKDARKTLDAKDRVIQKKNKKLDELAEADELRRNGTMEEREKQQLEDLRSASLEAEARVLALVAQVDAVTGNPATDSADLAARQSLDYVIQRLVDACATRGLAVDVMGERVEPGWQREINQAVEAGLAKEAAKAAARGARKRG